jgi:hypothetical protein
MPAFHELGPAQQFFFSRIFPWFIIFVGGGAIYLGFATVLKAKQSTDWPAVKGKVVESGIRAERGAGGTSSTGSRNTYHANVVYKYDVIGKIYTRQRVSFDEYGREDEVHATQISDKYPEGETVEVYYDPYNPSKSVLEPGSHGVPWFYIALGFPFLLFGGALAYFLPKQSAKIN